MDTTGKILKTTTAKTTLDLHDLPQGVYTIKDGNGTVQQLTKF